LAKAAKKGKKSGRVAAPKLTLPVPDLDAGLEALARSTKNLTRAESCLLLASATRLGVERGSATERGGAPTPPAAPTPKVSKRG
jgi:hypothetical protein